MNFQRLLWAGIAAGGLAAGTAVGLGVWLVLTLASKGASCA